MTGPRTDLGAWKREARERRLAGGLGVQGLGLIGFRFMGVRVQGLRGLGKV